MKVVVVESPSKAKTINKYLGPEFKVFASFGHIRDLPPKNGSVDPDQNFKMIWELNPRAKKYLDEIVKALKDADELLLATDPDREGEAISWHVLEFLNQNKKLKSIPAKRVVFHEITKNAVLEAVANPRELNQELVEAYLARRALDYLVGFTLSPVLWRKLRGSRSAGRVQSVALRLIAEREAEIEIFNSQEYWSISAQFSGHPQKTLVAKLTILDSKKLEKFDLCNEHDAKNAQLLLQDLLYHVSNIDKKRAKRQPYPPFTTSTLQQEASRKLGYGARRTMQIAQKLYEGINIGGETIGLITYMRTDSVNISQEAIQATRGLIEKTFGKSYVPSDSRLYKSKAKNAQEAHEGIRPTDLKQTPLLMKKYLDEEQFKLYELVWKRMVASQMENALIDQVGVDLSDTAQKHILRATGSTLFFDGFLKLYQESQDDEVDDEHRLLPSLEVGEKLNLESITPNQHFTQPPPRYSEASLVKRLEELGIGRPSTYASILTTLIERKYVQLDKKRLTPVALGRIVTSFLTSFFKQYVEYDFTAHLEEQLDEVSAGKRQWLQVLSDFWKDFNQAISNAQNLKISEVLDCLNDDLEKFVFPASEDHTSNRKCPKCTEGQLSLKLSKWGAFVGCSKFPECEYTYRILSSGDEGTPEVATPSFETRILGQDPLTQATIVVKKGPYGFYLEWEVEASQVGQKVEIPTPETKSKPLPKKTKDGKAKLVKVVKVKAPAKAKPKRVSLPKDISAHDVTLVQALSLGSLPRFIGDHPETKFAITAGIGRFGPYLKHDSKFKSLGKNDDIMTVDLDRAVEILSQISEKPFTRSFPKKTKS